MASQKRGERWKKKRCITQNGLECRRHSPKTRGAWIHGKHRTSWALKSQTKGPLTSRLNLLSTLWQNTMIKVSWGWNLLKLSLIHQEGKLEQEPGDRNSFRSHRGMLLTSLFLIACLLIPLSYPIQDLGLGSDTARSGHRTNLIEGSCQSRFSLPR